MKKFKIDNKGTKRLFSNRLLERLSRTHVLIPVALYSVLSLVFIVFSFFDEGIAMIHVLWLFPLGWIAFTLIEYLTHRFIFHFHATTESELNLQYNIHGVHHEFPRDKGRLAMPPVISTVLTFGFYFLFRFLMGEYGNFFFSGFVAGYAVYLIMHYAVHAMKPPKNFLKYFWKHHSLHHYDSAHNAFAVSMPLWDYLFGTLPRLTGSRKKEIQNRLPDSVLE